MEEVEKKPKIVEIFWEDAYSNGAWWHKEDLEKWISTGCPAYTVGYLVERSKKHIVVSSTWRDSGSRGAPWAIPLGMVKKYRVVER